MATPAEVAANSNNDSYNYYPQTMIQFCVISYQDPSTIPGAVEQSGWTVGWGPAQLPVGPGELYSMAYVAYRDNPQEYTVVIRGTNLDSWEDWLTEDFDIGTTVPFNQLVPSAPSGAAISQGTYNGVNDLLSLQDPSTGTSLVDYLSGVNPQYLYVTGHSLGGTLVPPMFAYLNSVLYGGGFVHNMACWSFAGLTPGNGDFNSYFNGLFNTLFPWRLYNPLDIAPDLWWSQAGLESIYSPQLTYGEPEKGFFDVLFDLAAGNGYAQPEYGGTPLPGTFQSQSGLFPWLDQAKYQHNHLTYQALVNQEYPVTATIGSRREIPAQRISSAT